MYLTLLLALGQLNLSTISPSLEVCKSCLWVLCVLPLQSFALADQDADLDSATSEQHIKSQSTFAYNLFKPVRAEPYWSIQTSAYTKHFKPKSKHNAAEVI